MGDDAGGRLEAKIDRLTTAIHEQNLSVVRLCEQMNSSVEAVTRAHARIDSVDGKVELLRDLPTRVRYLEKQSEGIVRQVEKISGAMGGNSATIAKAAGAAGILGKVWPYLVLAAVVVAMGTIGKITGS